MARTGAAPVVSFIPALPRNGHDTDAGRSYFSTVTLGEGVTLRPQVAAGEVGNRLPVNSKVALRSAPRPADGPVPARGCLRRRDDRRDPSYP